MDKISQSVFKNRRIVFEKLAKYGFALSGEEYVYKINIVDGQMALTVKVDCQGKIFTQVVDRETGEPYTLFLASDAVGSFVGSVRQEYERVLSDIADKCCVRQVFKSKGALAVIEYAKQRYGDELEFLWEKFDDNAVWRRKDNAKWYGVLLTVAKNKLGLDGEEKIEILDLRIDPQDVENTIDFKGYFPAYHMNKKSWITLLLDGQVDEKDLFKRIDDSYALAKKK